MPVAPRVALATCAEHPELDAEGRLPLAALGERGVVARPRAWSVEPEPDGDRDDLVVLRSTSDHVLALDEFLHWTSRIGGRLREVELSEPALFLEHEPGAAGRLADAIVATAGGRPGPP